MVRKVHCRALGNRHSDIVSSKHYMRLRVDFYLLFLLRINAKLCVYEGNHPFGILTYQSIMAWNLQIFQDNIPFLERLSLNQNIRRPPRKTYKLRRPASLFWLGEVYPPPLARWMTSLLARSRNGCGLVTSLSATLCPDPMNSVTSSPFLFTTLCSPMIDSYPAHLKSTK